MSPDRAAAAAATTYHWRGTDADGVASEGEIAETSMARAKAQLLRRGIRATELRKERRKGQRTGGHTGRRRTGRALLTRSVSKRDVVQVLQQLATLVQSGVPLIQALEIIAENNEGSKLADMMRAVRGDIHDGQTLSRALARHPTLIDEMSINLVGVGEESGALATMLERAAGHYESMERTGKKLKKAMTYPVLVAVIALVVTCVLLTWVVPQFEEIYSGFGARLPWITQVVIDLSERMREHGLMVLAGMVVLAVAVRVGYGRLPGARRGMSSVALRIPLWGSMVRDAAVARFARTLATTFAAGVPLLDALHSVASAVTHPIFADAILDVRGEVADGKSLHLAMRDRGLFPTLVCRMIAIGEETGELDKMLEHCARHFEDAVDDKVEALVALAEPLVMVVLGLVIGGLLLAMYMPIFNLGSVIGGGA